MQSKKASTKTPKPAQTKAAPRGDRATTGEAAAKTRSPRPANAASKSESANMASGKHHHKTPGTPATETNAAKTILAEPLATVENNPAKVMAVRAASFEQIAQLAHSYWAARGYAHGSHEEDWLRAEQELASE